MKVPSKIESVSIWIHSEIKGKENVERIFTGLKSAVNQRFYEHGYDVSDAFTYSSDNGFDRRFYIKIQPEEENGISQILIVDEALSQQYNKPTLELLTIEMIKAIRNREGLPYAFVYRSNISGLDFLENHIVREDMDVYILKYDISELNI